MDALASRLGQANGSGDVDALFLKVFSGEVLTAFANRTVTMGRHMVRTITSGKSAQFPRTGRTTAEYHVPGTEIQGMQINANEKVITIDDLLISHSFIANIDEAKNHYDVRSIYSSEMGVALANQMDKHVLQQMILAATASAAITGESNMAGSVIANADVGGSADVDNNPDDLIAAIFLAMQKLAEKSVPLEGVSVFVKPEHYFRLANSSKVQNVEFGNSGNGSTAAGKVARVAGAEIVMTNNLPTTNITSGLDAGDSNARHAVNASNTIAIVSHPSCVGTVKLMDLATEMEYDIRRQGTLLVAKYAVGHGVLRPEASVQIKTS